MRNTNTSEQGGQNILRLFITNQANALIRISFAYFTRFIRLDFHHSAVKCMACARGSVLAVCRSALKKFIGNVRNNRCHAKYMYAKRALIHVWKCMKII